ncbi:hypothetical protein BDA96_03G040400 [Sorghum bicolor]|uniref:Uncharacterized protein n=2 Tax=Sorghum bicolor TaxID=4558 RepID=A0A921UL62_SORBI|nr:hypothetical protein BDA96_03G040400 [Sorghum bicolor]OQU86172.1 hypothetical protein SORBI_3003G036950 [Sorghum bicolor]
MARGRWVFEGLTEESEHTRWFLSMSAMLGAVRAHSLSVSHSSGSSLCPIWSLEISDDTDRSLVRLLI